MRKDRRNIGPRHAGVKVPGALLVLLLALGVPRPPESVPPSHWDVLYVLVQSVDVTVPGLRGPRRIRVRLGEGDRRRIREETRAFARRVREGTGGRMEIRGRFMVVPGPLRSLSGPGPYWFAPEDLAPRLGPRVVGRADSVIAFVKIGEDRGPAVPTRHFGGAFGGDRGPEGACFAAVAFRPKWLDGTGTVLLHEWLHHLDWALTEVGGFPEDALPDPDDGRLGRPCCPGSPSGDGPFAEHLLRRHLTAALIRAADARRGPAVRDGWLRNWQVDGSPAPSPCRSVTLPPGTGAAVAVLPPGTRRILVSATDPVLVEGGRTAARVSGTKTVPVEGPRVTVRPAVEGRGSRVRIRVVPAP